VVQDFIVTSVNNSLQDAFVEITGSAFGSSHTAVSATIIFSMLRVLDITRCVVTLSGSGSEYDVGDTVRFSGTSPVSPLLSDVLYIVSNKVSPASVTLQTIDRVPICPSDAVVTANVQNFNMSVASPCFVNPLTFTSSTFTCAHTPMSVQAQLVVGISLELSVRGATKTFTFPDFTLVPAASRSLAVPTVSLVSSAQRVASSQLITVLGSNFGVNASAVAVAVSMPSRCERQIFATVAQQRPTPTVGSPAGSAVVTFRQLSLTSVSITIVATGLTSTLTGVHIRMLSVITDLEGPVVFSLCGASPQPCPTLLNPSVTANWNIESGLTSAILNGLFSARNIGMYVNLHTANNPSGELRADIKSELSTISCLALADAELPVSNVGNPSGSAIVTFSNLNIASPTFPNWTGVLISVSASGLTSNLIGVHIHMLSSMTDEIGPVVFALCGTSSSPSCPIGLSPTLTATWNSSSGLTSAVYDSMLSSSNIGLYANIHTVSNPSGELRADINVRGLRHCVPTQLSAGSALQALSCNLQLGRVSNATSFPIAVSVAESDYVSAALPLVVNSSARNSGSSFAAPASNFDTVPISPNSSLCSESATNALRLMAQSLSTIQRQSCAACGCPSLPTITSISTAHPGGGMVTIRGRHFGMLNQVVLNVDVPHRVMNYVSGLCNSVSQIDAVQFTAECPAPAGIGTNIHASVAIGGALPLAAPSMLNYALPPVIQSVSSITRDGGRVTVIGRNFGPNATQSVEFSVVNYDITVVCMNPVTVDAFNQMESFVCSLPSSAVAQAALNALLDVVITVNSLSIRSPAQFSYIDTPSVNSVSAAIRTDGRAEIAVTGSGFGVVASNNIRDIDLRLQVGNETIPCQGGRVVSGEPGGATTIACTLPPLTNSQFSYIVVFSVRGFRLQSTPNANFAPALTFPSMGGSQNVRGFGFGTTNHLLQLTVMVSDASRYFVSMLRPISSTQLQFLQTTIPESAARSFSTGDILLLISTMSTQSLASTSVVRFVHSKAMSNTFKLTSTASPRSSELMAQQQFPPLTAVIPLPPSDIVYLVQRRSSTNASAVMMFNSTWSFGVGDPVVFMGEVFGGVNVDTVYYIRATIGSNSFTLSLSRGGQEISVPSNVSSPMSGVMAIFSAYSTVITQGFGDTAITASPSLISIGDAVELSGAGTVSRGIYFVHSKPTPRSFKLSTAVGNNPILLSQYSAMIMARFVQRRCSTATSVSSSEFTCSGFPAFNDNNFFATADRFYPAIVTSPNSNYTTAVRWAS